MKLKLVSFSVCPFVQRAVLVLREKGADFDVEYIDLRDKPEWFLKKSPRGKVPILIVDDKDVLFESQAICEFLEETHPAPALFPEDAVGRARDRAWFTFLSEEVFMRSWKIESAKSEADLKSEVAGLREKLQILEDALEGRDWLSGDGARFGMADVGASSALYRMSYWQEKFGLNVAEELPRVAAWQARLVARESVSRSVPETWHEDYTAFAKAYDSALAA